MATSRRLSFVLLAGLAAATLLVIALAVDNRRLSKRYEELLRVATEARPGMYVPTFEGVTIDGDTLTIGEARPGHRQLLFFLTTTCPYCRASIPAWNELAATAPADVTVAAVALDSASLVEAYRRERGLEVPVLVVTDRRLGALYRVNRVPLTMLLDDAGRVLLARIGELSDPAAIDSVRSALTAEVSRIEPPPEGAVTPEPQSSDVP